jgi:uncharacterized protein YyaL (SSP411 family)
LALKGLTDAYQTFGEASYLELALQNAEFIWDNFYIDGHLLHTYKDGKASLLAYLEDYASVSNGYIYLYQCTFNEKYLFRASELIQYALDHFYDENEKLFYFTDDQAEDLIARKKEIMDNVIPSSNALICESLYITGHLLEKLDWVKIAENAITTVSKLTSAEPYYMAHWASLSILSSIGLTEIAIIGPEVNEFKKSLLPYLLPSTVILGSSDGKSSIPLLQHPIPVDGKTAIYICRDFTCLAPVYSVEESLKLIAR